MTNANIFFGPTLNFTELTEIQMDSASAFYMDGRYQVNGGEGLQTKVAIVGIPQDLWDPVVNDY